MRLSLRRLLLLLTAACVMFGLAAYTCSRRDRVTYSISEIERSGGRVFFRDDYDDSGLYRPERTATSASVLLRRLIFGRAFCKVAEIDFSRSSITDDDLFQLRPHLLELDTVREFALSGTAITDRGLAFLPSLPQLKVLWLNETRISDAGLVTLAKFPQLQSVLVNQTAVSDCATDAIANLRTLKLVNLYETRFTTTGFLKLRRRVPTLAIGTPTHGLEWAYPRTDTLSEYAECFRSLA
jgi:hypothetical protein